MFLILLFGISNVSQVTIETKSIDIAIIVIFLFFFLGGGCIIVDLFVYLFFHERVSQS